MKESIYSPIKAPIFRETFDSESGVRSRGGQPTAVTFANGQASCVAANSSKIYYPNKPYNGTYSVRIKFSNLSITGTPIMCDFRNITADGLGYIQITSSSTFNAPTGTLYNNGIATGSLVSNKNEIIVSGLTIKSIETFINSRYSSTLFPTASYELLEIYEGTLTSQEVSNLYNNKRYKDLSPHGDLLSSELITSGDFSSATGWTLGTDVTIANGKMNFGSMGRAFQAGVLTQYKKYLLTYTITDYTSGSMRPQLGVSGATGTVRTSTGTFTEILLANVVNQSLLFNEVNIPFVGSIDNVSLKEIVSNNTEILNIDGKNGTISNKYSNGTTIPNVIPTNVTSVKQGSITAMNFNTATSKIDCGNYDSLVGDKTFVAWINPRSGGNGTAFGRIFDNGKFTCFNVSNTLSINSDGTTTANSPVILKVFTNQMIVITRTSTGVTTIYYNGVLSGTPNQSSGTPVAGTTNLFIGNRNTNDRAFDGTISGARIINGILSAEDVSQLWSNERKNYNV